MTKPIVSIAAMILHERGKLYPSEPIYEYLPEFREMKVLKINNKGKESLYSIKKHITYS